MGEKREIGRRRAARLAVGAAGYVATALAFAGGARAEVAVPGSEKKCASCDFWGGPRRVSADGASAIVADASATGICSNPTSPLYQKQSRASQGYSAGHARWRALKQ